MIAASALAIAAVLTRDRVVFAETTAARVLREIVLPAPAVAIFAAPDGRVVMPLAESDETLVVSPAGSSVRWPGRVFPVFFDEPDRMHIVLPELLLIASYPERLPILRVPVPGLKAPWRAVSTGDGILVAICAMPSERRLVMAVAEPGAPQREVALAGEPRALAMAPGGEWIAVGLADGVQVEVAGEPQARPPLPVAGSVRTVAVSSDGRDVLVGTALGRGGRLVVLRVNPKVERGLKERDVVELAGPVEAVAAAGDDVLAVIGDTVVVLGRHGRKPLRELPVRGARQVAVLPADPTSVVPLWSDAPPQ